MVGLMRGFARALFSVAALLSLLAAGSARADEPTAPAAPAPREDPDALFERGNTLMDQGKNEEACPLFARSLELDPSLGTRVNLAICYEKIGKLGSAYRLFREVRDVSHDTGKQKREDEAQQHLAAIRADATFATIRPEDRAQTDLLIRIDGVIVPVADYDFYPLDPGTHAVAAVAPKKKPFETSLAVKEPRGEKHDLVVPALQAEVVVEKKIERVTNARRTAAYIAGGVGGVALVAAAVTGGIVLDAQSTADAHCTGAEPSGKLACDSKGSDAVKRGQSLQWVNVASFGVAAVGLGVGGWLFFTSGEKADGAKSAALYLAPYVGLGGGGVKGEF
jgi:hypothetical protein